MDFFSTGGFQQLLSDLHGSKLDLPIMGCCDIENLKGYLIERTESDQSYSLNNDESCYNSEEFKRDICKNVYKNTCNGLLHVNDPFVATETDLKHLMVLDTQTLYYNNIELSNDIAISEKHLQHSADELLLPNTSSYENINGEQINTNSKHTVVDERESVTFMAREIDEWEENFLDNYIEIPELIDFLPEKTPLCTELCEHFLKESSNNLKLYYKNKNPASNSKSDSDKSYPCTFDNCQKMYSKPAHLKAHLRRHWGEKPYICTWPQCTWKFSRSDELARHRRSHSGVKPYKCNYCFKCFARSDHLTKHRKVHERRLLAASKVGKSVDSLLPLSVFSVRPGRKRKNQEL